MDCGNKDVTVDTNNRMLNFLEAENNNYISPSVQLENSTIIPPCYIGDHVVLKNTTIGPNVSLGDHSVVENATIKNSLIQTHAYIAHANLDNAMIGNHAKYNGNHTNISIGDYSVLD